VIINDKSIHEFVIRDRRKVTIDRVRALDNGGCHVLLQAAARSTKPVAGVNMEHTRITTRHMSNQVVDKFHIIQW